MRKSFNANESSRKTCIGELSINQCSRIAVIEGSDGTKGVIVDKELGFWFACYRVFDRRQRIDNPLHPIMDGHIKAQFHEHKSYSSELEDGVVISCAFQYG